jgi:hypothetical protein
MPRNAATGQRYRGIDVLSLGMSSLAFSSGDPRWATYKQAEDRSWQVRRGERGTTRYFFKQLELCDDSRPEDDEEAGRRIPPLQAFTLFHTSQIDGIPVYFPPTVAEAPWRAPEVAEIILANSQRSASLHARSSHEREDYPGRQRRLSERTIAGCWRFADRFLSFRLGETDISFRAITPGDVVAFLQQLFSCKAPYRDKTLPTHEALPRALMPYRGRRLRPYIYCEGEVANIVAATAELLSAYGLRGLTYTTLFGLIAVTGLRISKALALNAGDIDLDTGVLTIRRGKLRKTQLVPLDTSVTEPLLTYIRERDRLLGVTP